VLVIDIGGTNVKMLASGEEEIRKFPSGPTLTPAQMVRGVRKTTADWEYDHITIGFPGPIKDGKIVMEPKNLGPGWLRCDFAAKFGMPVRLVNDAAMQALGSYESGRMLFMGLGTGLGTAFVMDGVVAPLELAHLPYKKDMTFEDYLGLRGLESMGKKKWQEAVDDVVARLKDAFVADVVVLGGGNSKKLKYVPPGARLGDNTNAFLGGFRVWVDKKR
jgi:polyphosphate glucokinase